MEKSVYFEPPTGYKFSEVHSHKGYTQFNFGDLPFAVTVFAFPTENGHVTDWYVSGRRRIDEPQTALVMKLTFSIQEHDQWILEGKINQIWDNYLLDLAIGSALVAGSLLDDLVYLSPPLTVRSEFLTFHLFANDRFAELLREPKISKVERTARWHLLLLSFGVKQTHQFIANYESNFVGLLDGSLKRVSPASINQRLQTARKQGLLIELPPSERRNNSTTRRKTKDEQPI